MYKNLSGDIPQPAALETAACAAPRGVSRRHAVALAAVPLLQLAPRSARAQTGAPLKIGFVYVSPIGQAGWTFQHEQARLELEAELSGRVETRCVESVPEGADAERVLRELAAQGHELIFATSFGYLEPALRVAREFPKVKFEHAGGYKTAANLATYNARYYEARYLAGMLAGLASRSAVAGYVAGFPVPEVVQGINAFTLGMRSVQPQAQVRVLWLNTWFDPARERDAALTLVSQRADVLTNHSGSPAVPLAAEERGVQVVGYQSDMSRFAPAAQLAAVTHHWGPYYTRCAREVLAGTWQPTPVWGGMKQGWVRLSALRADLPSAWRQQVEVRRNDIVAGRFAPFSGRLLDNTGTVRHAQGVMADPAISDMDWFVQGVAGAVPKA